MSKFGASAGVSAGAPNKVRKIGNVRKHQKTSEDEQKLPKTFELPNKQKCPKTFENESEEKRQGVCSQLKCNEMFTARELPVRALQILKFVHFS